MKNAPICRAIISTLGFIACYLLVGCAANPSRSVNGWKLVEDGNGSATFGGAALTRLDDFFILHLSGTPYEMGYQQGVLLRKDINKFAGDSWEYVDDGFLKNLPLAAKAPVHDRARSIAEKYLPYIPQEYIDEMKGIADGSGVAFNDILLANVFIEASAHIMGGFLCTSLVFNGPKTFDGSLVHAYNTDSYFPLKGRNYIDSYKGIIFYHPKKGRPFATVTSCGYASVFTGMNDKGIAVSIVCPLSFSAEYGMPVRFLIRRILEKADNLAEAQNMAEAARRTIQNNITVSDGKTNQAATVSFSPPYPPGQTAWTKKIIEVKDCEMAVGNGKPEISGIIKQSALKEQFGINDIAAMLRYQPRDGGGICSNQTSYSVIYHPSSLRFWVGLGETPAPEGVYYGFDFNGNRLPENNTQFPAIIPPAPQRPPDTKELNQTISKYDEALRLNPKDVAAFNNRGNAYKSKGELDRAIKDYDEALRLDPGFSRAFYNRGIAYFEKGELDRAIKDYDEALRLNPEYAVAYFNRGFVYAQKLERESRLSGADSDTCRELMTKAVSDWERFLELAPNDPQAPALRQSVEQWKKQSGKK